MADVRAYLVQKKVAGVTQAEPEANNQEYNSQTFISKFFGTKSR